MNAERPGNREYLRSSMLLLEGLLRRQVVVADCTPTREWYLNVLEEVEEGLTFPHEVFEPADRHHAGSVAHEAAVKLYHRLRRDIGSFVV